MMIWPRPVEKEKLIHQNVQTVEKHKAVPMFVLQSFKRRHYGNNNNKIQTLQKNRVRYMPARDLKQTSQSQRPIYL